MIGKKVDKETALKFLGELDVRNQAIRAERKAAEENKNKILSNNHTALNIKPSAFAGRAISEEENRLRNQVFSDYTPGANSMTKAEYEMRRGSNPSMPEFGSYAYFVQREKEVGEIIDAFALDGDFNEYNKAIVDAFNNKVSPTAAISSSYNAKEAERLAKKYSQRDRALEEYKRISEYLDKFEGKGEKLYEDGEVDTDTGIKQAEQRAERSARAYSVSDVPYYKIAGAESKSVLGGFDIDKIGLSEDEKRAVFNEALAMAERDAYKKYDKNKDNEYSDGLFGRIAGNYRLSRTGINASEAGMIAFEAGSDNLTAKNIYDRLSYKIQSNNAETFKNEGLFEETIAELSQYAPQFVDQMKAYISGRIAGAAIGTLTFNPEGIKQMSKLLANAETAEYIYRQTTGAAYARLLENGVSVEDAKILAKNEGILSGLIEFGLGFALDQFGGIYKKARGKLAGEAAEEVVQKTGVFVKLLKKAGMSEASAKKVVELAKKAGRLGLDALGEGAEEGMQTAVSQGADRISKEQGSGSLWELAKETVQFDKYTEDNWNEIKDSAKAGFTLGFVPGATVNTAQAVGLGAKGIKNAVTNRKKTDKGSTVLDFDDGSSVEYSTVSFDGEQMTARETDTLAAKIWNKKDELLGSEKAFDVDESSIEKAETPSQGIFNLFQKWGGKAVNPELGTVELNKKGAKNTVLHGIGEGKYIASAAIKDVIEKGKIIEKQENWKGRGYDTYIIAAEGNVNGEKSVVGVVVKNYPNGKMDNKFYLHEVIKIGENFPATAADENISVTNADKFSPNAETSDTVNGNNSAISRMKEVSTDTITHSNEKVKVSGVELGENGKKIFSTIKPSGDTESFNKTVSEYYKLGLSGIDFDKVREAVGHRSLSELDARRIHKAGMMDGARKRTGGVVASSKAVQKVGAKTVRALDRIGKRLNVIIEFRDTLGNKNGKYKDGKIIIALDSDNPYIVVAAHEITHHIKETAGKAVYEKFRNMAVSYEAKKAGMTDEELIREKIRLYKEGGEAINREEAMDEIAADFTREVFENEKELSQFLARTAKEGQENKNAIQQFIESIKDVFRKIGDLIPQSDRAGLEDVIKSFERAYASAVRNVQNGKTVKSGKAMYNLKMDFKHQVDAALDGKLKHTLSVYVGRTPNLLIKCGLDGDLPMLMNQSHLRDINHPKDDKNIHWHGLSRDDIKQIPKFLREPVMIYDSISEENSENAVCVVTSLKDGKNPIIITIRANSNQGNKYLDVSLNEIKTDASNFVTSMYERNNFAEHIQTVIEKDALLYANKNKTLKLFSQKGLQLPERFNSLGFDNIIHQSRNIVNTYSTQKGGKYSAKGDILNTILENKKLKSENENTESKYSAKELTGKQDIRSKGKAPQAKQNLGQQLNDWIKGKGKKYGAYNGRYFDLGNTPDVFAKHGVDQLPFVMTENCIIKVTGGKHAISLNEIAKLPMELNDPVLLFSSSYTDKKGKTHPAFVALTEMVDKYGNDVIAIIHINKHQDRMTVNKIASLYSKSDSITKENHIESYVKNQIKEGKLLDASTKKASTWFTSRGLQLPKLVQTIIDANNNITQEENIVNTYSTQNTGKNSAKGDILNTVLENKKLKSENENTESKNSVKGLTEGKITLEMSDAERVKILNKKSVNVVNFNSEKTETLKNIDFNTLQKTFAKNARPVIRKVAEAFGIFDKVYYNADIEVEFEYSKGSLRESVHNQKTMYGDFVKMLSVFPDVIRNAVGVETHKDKYKGTRREDFDLKQTYVLASALKDESGIIPVKLEVKEFDKKTNKLYLSVVLTKKESRYLSGDPWQSQTYTTPPTFIISIADLVSIVNPQEGDFLKYFPDSMLDSEQIKGKQAALEKDAEKIEGLKESKNSVKGNILNTVIDELVEKYGSIPKGENPARDIDVPRKTEEDKKVSQTVRTILEAKATPDEAIPNIEKMVEDGVFSYDVYSDKKAINNAEFYIKEYGWDESLDDWFDDVEKGVVSKQNTAMGWALYNNAANIAATTTSETERTSAIKTSLKILDTMVKHQRSAAQALQATRILKKLSPETQLYGVQKSVQALQREISDRYGEKAPNLKIDEKLAKQFLKAETQEKREAIKKEIYKDIGRQMPSRFIDKWNAWRYLAMLGNFRTHIRNIVGNAGFAPVVLAKDLTAAAIEGAVNRVSKGKIIRSKAVIRGSKADRTLLKAAWNDYKNASDIISSGGKYDEFEMANKNIEEGRRIFESKPLDWARKKNSALLETEDMWFARPHYAYALAQYCKAHNITAEQIQRGIAIKPARVYAVKEAQKATYRDTNAFSQMVSEWGRGSKKEKNVIKKAFNTVVEGILPFRKTPANILVRGVEYSPIGLLKGLSYDLYQVRKGEMTATEAIDNISAGLTGTGLLALGVLLAAQGLIRGHGEDEEKEKDFKELTGHQSYALELPDGKSVTLDWLAPEALPFFAGVNIWETTKGSNEEVNLSAILKSISNISEPMLEMSCLQSLNDLFESIGYSSSNDTSGLVSVLSSAVTSYLTQGIPTLLGQAERTGEEYRMTTYTEKSGFLTGDMQYTLGRASSKIPFWDYNQIPYVDAWGRKEASGMALKRGLNNFLNPAYTSTIETSKMEEELLRLYEETGEGGVFPSRADKYFTVDGERKDLTADEYVRYATLKGEKSYELVSDLVKSNAYKKLSDEEKVKAVKEAYDYANQKAKQAVSNYKPEAWVKKADGFGSSVGDYISFKTNVNGTKEDNGGKISKQEAVNIILGTAQNDLEVWEMYLSMYGSDKDMYAYNNGIDGEDYMNFLILLDRYDKPTKTGKYGTYTQEEAENAIRQLRGLSRQEKAVLWQSVNTGWKASNNPWR